MEKKLLVIAVKLLILLGYATLSENPFLNGMMFELEMEFKSLLEVE